MSNQKEFGDFQTPEHLADKAVSLIDKLFGVPDIVIEPTAGLGTFLKSSVVFWGNRAIYKGYEIKKEYVDLSRKSLSEFGVEIFHRDFFYEDWKNTMSQYGESKILIIGNPPWVTNSQLGQLESENIPMKSNFQGLVGLDARTGKSNFDIAEWMLIRLIESLPSEGAVAMLCKTMTARKVLRHFWKTDEGREQAALFHIDAKKEFDVAVDACLFFVTGKRARERVAISYTDLDIASASTRFGFIRGDLVSNIDLYHAHKKLDGGAEGYIWRSGMKHDAAKVMEFTRNGAKLINGLGEEVELEEDYVFPLLKSSDIGNGRIDVRKAVLVTQRHTGDDTAIIAQNAPKTWKYLLRYASVLDKRKSSIYQKRPRFSIFGIGDYSFSHWKIAISGLYKKICFVIIPPSNGRPVMVDDTCYSISCQSRKEAEFIYSLLSSGISIDFLNSLIFWDSKRPVTIDILRRISFIELARALGKIDEMQQIGSIDSESCGQLLLPIEPQQKYQTRCCIRRPVAGH